MWIPVSCDSRERHSPNKQPTTNYRTNNDTLAINQSIVRT